LEFAEENVEEIVTFLLEQACDNKDFDDVLAIIKNS
jgi:hypothetical protein